MSAKDTATTYGSLTRSLHWLLFVLIVIQFALAFSFGFFPKHSSAKSAAIMLHESVGVLILIFGVLFILWRWSNPKPSLDDIPAWQRGSVDWRGWSISLSTLRLLRSLSSVS